MSRTNKLPAATLPLSANDKFEVSQNGAPKQVAFSEMVSPGGAAVWGTITGTITDQTDLTSYITGLGYITGITGGMVTTALGYTPYDAANPAGYITASSANTLTNKTWNGNVIAAIYGGTGWGSYTAGDMLYAYDASTLAKLPKGTNGQVLTMVSGVPGWAAAGGGGWALTGNAGTNPATNFIGTTDNNDMVFKTNNTEQARLISGSVMQFTTGMRIKLLGSSNGGNANILTVRRDLGEVTFPVLSFGASWNTLVLGTGDGASAQITAAGICSKGMPITVSDNSGSGFVKQGAVFPGLNLCDVVGGNEMTIGFWEKYSIYSCKGVISGKKNAKGGGRGGDLIFYTSDGSVADPNTYLKEVMRLSAYGGVLIGTTTDTISSILTVDSTSKGFLPPRMTTTQRTDIATPAKGLIVFDTTLDKLFLFTTAWEQITSV